MSKFSEFWKLVGRDTSLPSLEEARAQSRKDVGEVPVELIGEGYRAVEIAESGAVREMKLGLASASRNPPEETGVVDPKTPFKKRPAEKKPSKKMPKLKHSTAFSEVEHKESMEDDKT